MATDYINVFQRFSYKSGITHGITKILSFPGPDRSIKDEDLENINIVARRYRNRRIGEFLKELDLTEGRCTGIPKMAQAMKNNGSPAPIFKTDNERSYFLAIIPIHPFFLELNKSKQHEAHDEAHDKRLTDTEQKIVLLCQENILSRSELEQKIGYKKRSGNFKKALLRLLELKLLAYLINLVVKSKNTFLQQKGKIICSVNARNKNLTEDRRIDVIV